MDRKDRIAALLEYRTPEAQKAAKARKSSKPSKPDNKAFGMIERLKGVFAALGDGKDVKGNKAEAKQILAKLSRMCDGM